MKKILILFLFIWPASIFAQDNDFQAWYSLNVSAKLNKTLSFDFSDEIRTFNNASYMAKNLVDVGLSKEFGKKTEVGLYTRITTDDPLVADRYSSLSFYANLGYQMEFSNFQLSGRLRFGTDDDGSSSNVLLLEHREKIGLSYNIKKSKLTPEVSAELFFPANRQVFELSKTRCFAGVSFKLAKNHKLTLSYGWQHKFLKTVPENDYILSIDYKYSFKAFGQKK